jgi:hypothetical protein
MRTRSDTLHQPRAVHVRRLGAGLLGALILLAFVADGASAFSQQLRRYPYLTDAVAGGVTVNWATDRSVAAGSVTWGIAGSEACTARPAAATPTAVNVNGVLEYQWKARLAVGPDTTFCYRVFGGAVDLLGTDAAPQSTTQVTPGSAVPFTFAVFGDWGLGQAGGNPGQAGVMQQMVASGARFAIATGDTGYPAGSQGNYGDLLQTGLNVSGVFGPQSWRVPGASIPLYNVTGNHGYNATFLSTWPSENAAAASGGQWAASGTGTASFPNAWYAFDQGNTRFYMLSAAWADSRAGPGGSYQADFRNHWTPSSAEYQWLQNDLATHPSQLKFAIWHFPLYSDNASEASNTLLQGPSSLQGLLNRYGVDIAFNGHAHIYQRNAADAAGMVSYVSGGGGATLQPVNRCSPVDAYGVGWTPGTARGSACGAATRPTSGAQVNHFLLVTVNGAQVTVTPTDSTGRTFDVQTYTFGP